jgi:flagellar basal body P-ring formation protein FlgA
MLRITLSLFVLALGVDAAAAQGGPRLRPQATVAGDVVRVGDLVENAGPASSTPIFRAPDLGETGSVPTRAVVDAVRAAGLIAVDTRGLTEVSVTHASRTIATSEIEQRISAALTERYNLGKAEDLKLTFDRDLHAIELPITAAGDLAVARATFNQPARRYDVTFELAGAARTQWRYTGVAIETVEAAIATRGLSRGDVIRESDVMIERRPRSELNSEVPAPTVDIVGRAARGNVRAGQLLRAVDVMKVEMVRKHDMVMLHYAAPGIALTMRGQAMDSGGEGDVVNVLNPNSKRTVQGVVTAAGHVTIAAPKPAQTETETE